MVRGWRGRVDGPSAVEMRKKEKKDEKRKKRTGAGQMQRCLIVSPEMGGMAVIGQFARQSIPGSRRICVRFMCAGRDRTEQQQWAGEWRGFAWEQAFI